MTDEFEFGIPLEQCPKCTSQEKEINDLYVLIDTLQANLRSATSVIENNSIDNDITNIPSYNWCINWKPGDSL